MNEKNRLKILIGVICAMLLLFVVVVAVMLDSQLPDPIFGIFQTEPSTTETQSTTQGAPQGTENTEPVTTESTGATEATKNTEPVTTDPTGTTEATENTEPVTTDPTGTTEATENTEPVTTDPTGTTEATENTEPATTESTSPTEETNQETENTEPVNTEPTDPTEETESSTQETDDTDPTDPTDSTDEPPPSVDIPPEKDPETGEEIGVSFPCQIPGYDMTIEKMGPYSGMFVEDGSNTNSQNVAMLLVKNHGDSPVEYAQIRVMCEQEELLFDISALPAGESLVVQEKTGKSISEDKATAVSALVVRQADMEMSEGKVQVTDNGNNTLTVKNLTGETIPTVRVFYKYYMEQEKLFVGGIAFTVRIARLGAGASVTIQPSHYTSQTSRVVMVLTYDSEV